MHVYALFPLHCLKRCAREMNSKLAIGRNKWLSVLAPALLVTVSAGETIVSVLAFSNPQNLSFSEYMLKTLKSLKWNTVYLTGHSLLCDRVGRVCRLWHSAASSPVLWHKVTLGHCWIAPGRSQLPKTEQKIKDTINWLAQNRSVSLLFVQD